MKVLIKIVTTAIKIKEIAMNSNTKISKREREILRLIAFEKTSLDISRMLHISPETAKTHRRNFFQKLQVSNVAGLIRKAFETGLIKTNSLTN